MQSIARHCPKCREYHQVLVSNQSEIHCPQCNDLWGKMDTVEKVFDFCPICQGRQFYTNRDFNQFVGCLIMLPGIVLVPWTFGLSLPFFALSDWLMYKRVPSMICCYKCGSEFRGFSAIKEFKPFLHHIGLKYDRFRDQYR